MITYVEHREIERPVLEGEACAWFALCDNDAVHLAYHPIIGATPICEPCRARFDVPVLAE